MVSLVGLRHIHIGGIRTLEAVIVDHDIVIEVEIIAYTVGSKAQYRLVLAICGTHDMLVVETPLLDMSPPQSRASLEGINRHLLLGLAVTSVILIEESVETAGIHPEAIITLLCLHK